MIGELNAAQGARGRGNRKTQEPHARPSGVMRVCLEETRSVCPGRAPVETASVRSGPCSWARVAGKLDPPCARWLEKTDQCDSPKAT